MAKKHHKQSKTNDTLGEQICNANHRQELVSLIYKELLKLEGECSGETSATWWKRKPWTFPLPTDILIQQQYMNKHPLWEIQKLAERLLHSRQMQNQPQWSQQENMRDHLTMTPTLGQGHMIKGNSQLLVSLCRGKESDHTSNNPTFSGAP